LLSSATGFGRNELNPKRELEFFEYAEWVNTPNNMFVRNDTLPRWIPKEQKELMDDETHESIVVDWNRTYDPDSWDYVAPRQLEISENRFIETTNKMSQSELEKEIEHTTAELRRHHTASRKEKKDEIRILVDAKRVSSTRSIFQELSTMLRPFILHGLKLDGWIVPEGLTVDKRSYPGHIMVYRPAQVMSYRLDNTDRLWSAWDVYDSFNSQGDVTDVSPDVDHDDDDDEEEDVRVPLSGGGCRRPSHRLFL
jgi:hypothetical protein